MGIIAAFLREENRRDAMKGVDRCGRRHPALPGRGPRSRRATPPAGAEQLETVIGLVAVGMVTWMIVWMRRMAQPRGACTTGRRRVGHRFHGRARRHGILAVLREGLETAVFHSPCSKTPKIRRCRVAAPR
jgi:high-affinity iron transporter